MPERPQAALRLEPHIIPTLRAAFDEALHHLRPQLHAFVQWGSFDQPYIGDPVSSTVRGAFDANIAGSPTPAHACLVAYQEELTKIRDTLPGMEITHRRTEGDNTALWARPA